MVHALAGAGAAVDDDAEVAMTLGDGDLLCHPMEVAEEGVVRGGEIVQGRDVLARQDEQMERRAGIDVADHDRVLVLVHARRPCLAATDSAEEAVGHAFRLTVFGRHPQEYPEYSMDFGFTPEQELLRRTARDLLADRAPMARVRQMIADDSGLDDADWRRMAALGWQGLVVPEQYGGAGLGLLELAIVLEEMGRACLPGPYLDVVLAATLLAAAGGQDALLAELSAGRTLVTLAREEAPFAGSPGAPARFEGGRVRGTKYFVPFAAAADALLVATRDGVCLVRKPFAVTALATLDPGQRFGEVRLDHAATLVGPPGLLERVDLVAAVAAGAMLLGIMARLLEMTIAYVQTRQAFRRPIGAFQVLQHRLADMLLKAESTRSAVYRAAWCLDTSDADAVLACAAAKAYAGDASRLVCGEAIQMHGGIGFTWELDLHFYFKRAKTLEQHYGSTEVQLERALVAAGY